MAKVTLNQLFDALRGGLGQAVFRQRPDGAIILSGAPSYNKGQGSPKQKAYRAHFREAAKYARWAAQVHPMYGELAREDIAARSWKSAYNFALSDRLKPPVIHRIERREGRILVEASDNIGVTSVRVTVLDEDGRRLEKGEAMRGEGNWWEFPCLTQGKTIVAEARDLAENVTESVL